MVAFAPDERATLVDELPETGRHDLEHPFTTNFVREQGDATNVGAPEEVLCLG